MQWAAADWKRLNQARDYAMETIAVTGFGLLGGAKTRFFQGEPRAVRITVSEFRDYLLTRGHRGWALTERLDDCLLIESIFLSLHRRQARDNVKRMNR